MHLKDLKLEPPGRWRYQEARTGHVMIGTVFDELVHKVAQHRANMNLPLVTAPFDTLAAEIEAWLCQQIREKDRERWCEEKTRITKTQPGHVFSSIIQVITGRYAVTCGRCMERMGQMNNWGWWGCWQHRETILNWIFEEAAGRGHPVSRERISTLFVAALREIRQNREHIAELDDQAP
jgi:hypothetical protein